MLYYKRYKARKDTGAFDEYSKKFNEWHYEASAKKIKCDEGKMTPEEYDNWNFEYFPNRKGNKFFKD